MLHKDFIKTVKNCPFCEFLLNRIIIEDENAFLTCSIAPYSRHHLIIVPNRHIEYFKDLNETENNSIDGLIRKGVNI